MPDAPKILPIKPRANKPPRGTTTQRGYGWAHQQQRARRLAQQPLCERCGEDWAAHLHHRDRNPHNRDAANVELLCQRCHDIEHGAAK